MSWSLNEVEGLARKAARGAGYSWGLAEEAGKATRWTSAAGWPGAAALAQLLTQTDGVATSELGPASLSKTWTAKSGALCPITTGAVLCDLASDWANGASLSLGPVLQPMLLIPYAVWAADRTGAALSLSWEGLTLTRADGETYLDDPKNARQTSRAEWVRLSPATIPEVKPTLGARLTRCYRADMSAETTATLTAFAQRTYAPETEESRLSGAGAGLTDND
ncbi:MULTISPECIES: DUF3726 domain-containing protein [Roseovarius]|uniref:DUF3726 domain-containing protein n=2 Tax=Roseovarius TaxID=74030 RepID=A0ABZ2HH99_9RHOB|nr:DUF3726 domain-containing protein [Roseovarius sp. W115]MDV2931063.1 DUF3726 domain-containing protein [Roseovarius sp. W115]